MANKKLSKLVAQSICSVLVAGFLLIVGEVDASASRTIKGAYIESQAMEFVMDRIPWDPDETEVSVVYRGKDVVVPEGKLAINFDLPSRHIRLGRFPVTVKIMVGNVLQKRLRLMAHVIHYAPVIKTLRPVNRGQILTERDVVVEIVPSNRILRNAMTSLDDVVGNQAVRNMGMGRVVTMNSLRKPTLVNKGDQVTLIALSGGMRITAPGIVREKGFKDSLVKVINIQTKKTVFGKVMDSKTVKVIF